MHLPRYESRGGRLRKTATSLHGLDTFAPTAQAIAHVIARLNSRDSTESLFLKLLTYIVY